eukprot:CAMPEP_0119066744 /NCGR_PEP_ID=MMETSP1178-20130426/9212_1 /TAXON_ID=33656 /ORGANISM="unid sp, Strain CCMP2000" /LENGTH=68 /DNA_ID=CAMNT_0007048361 /DNA_START=53 /DNA_END=259 /DNA_ORIENTATION=-
MVESTTEDELKIAFANSDEIQRGEGSGFGYLLAATRAQLRSCIQDGKLRIKAKFRVKEAVSVTLKTEA